jgi:aspartate aminotransferase-like enzyme
MTHRLVQPASGTFFLPGPTEVRPAVLQAMSGRMISHRSAEFRVLYARVQRGLRVVFGTSRPVFVATSSATGLMEAAIRNAPAGRVLALVNGGFSERFANVSVACGRAVDRYEVAWGAVHDPVEVTARVRAGGHAVVSVVHSETSTGALNDVRAISDAAHAAGAVCVIDSVSGIRGAELRFDDWGLDYVFTGSQKALAIPPGLAFAVASGQFLLAGEHDRRGIYFDLAEFETNAERDETPNTPALSLYYALDVQLESVLAEGMPGAWARHAAMCARTGDWAARLQQETGMAVTPLVAAGYRSPTVTAIRTPPGMTPRAIVHGMAERGYTIGGGYGQLKDSTVRIGHMGDHTLEGLEGCLTVCGEVLRALRT